MHAHEQKADEWWFLFLAVRFARPSAAPAIFTLQSPQPLAHFTSRTSHLPVAVRRCATSSSTAMLENSTSHVLIDSLLSPWSIALPSADSSTDNLCSPSTSHPRESNCFRTFSDDVPSVKNRPPLPLSEIANPPSRAF